MLLSENRCTLYPEALFFVVLLSENRCTLYPEALFFVVLLFGKPLHTLSGSTLAVQDVRRVAQVAAVG